MDRFYINNIVRNKSLTNVEYRIILALLTREHTYKSLSSELNIPITTITSSIDILEEQKLISISNINNELWISCNSKIINEQIEDANKLCEYYLILIDEFNNFTTEKKESLSSNELKRYLTAIEFMSNELLYKIDTLDKVSSILCDLTNPDSYTTDPFLFVSENTIERQLDICQDYYISAELTFLNKKITQDSIENFYEKVSKNAYYDWESSIARTAYEEYLNTELVQITKLEIH